MAIIPEWDCPRLAINFLMRDFQLWLINEKLAKRLHSDGRTRIQTVNLTAIWWMIQKICSVARVKADNLISIRNYSTKEASGMLMNGLDGCSTRREIRL